MTFFHIADLEKFTHSVPGIIVYITGLFHIANLVWKHFVAFAKRVMRGLGQLVREARKLWKEISGGTPLPRRRKGGQQ